MATLYGTNMTALHSSMTTPSVVSQAATVRAFVEVVTLAAQATTDTIEVGVLPKGAKFLYGIINNSATLGSSTVAIGISGATGKYRAAATKTSTTPEVFGVTAGMNVRISADETVIVTIAAADLPSSGTMVITLVYAHD
jgi:hypothetical protein